ncbi:MAG: hypothetical protein HYX74_09650 [Acidobacteria bacterium]|nr:hypothetical protein [Acidobacteriota bacterium]
MAATEKAPVGPLHIVDYRTLSFVSGPLVFIEGVRGAGYGELYAVYAEACDLRRLVNALDDVLLPRLQKQRDTIEMVLEEREREDRFRLKRVKLKLAERRAGV